MNQPVCHIHHNLFMRNFASYGGVFSSNERRPLGGSPLSMTNCTFIDNRSEFPGSEPSIARLRGNERLNLSGYIIWGGEQVSLFQQPEQDYRNLKPHSGRLGRAGEFRCSPRVFRNRLKLVSTTR